MVILDNLQPVSDGDQLNDGWFNASQEYSLRFNILNKIRQTIDRTSVDSSGQDDIRSEAYTDSNGQNNTVGGSTDADFASNVYRSPVTAGTVEDANTNTTSGTSLSYNYDVAILADGFFSAVRIATTGSNWTTASVTIKKNGTTVASKSTGSANDFNFTFASGDFSEYLRAGDTCNIAIASSGVQTKVQSGISYSQTNFTTTNVTVNANTGGNELSYTPITVNTTPVVVEHSISSGTYPATVSKLIGKALFKDWESGVTIEHRLENASENSGWISDGTLSTFTAFTSEPTKYLVRLTSKTSGVAGYPAIRGAGFYTE